MCQMPWKNDSVDRLESGVAGCDQRDELGWCAEVERHDGDRRRGRIERESASSEAVALRVRQC